jgi:hypothetical protein
MFPLGEHSLRIRRNEYITETIKFHLHLIDSINTFHVQVIDVHPIDNWWDFESKYYLWVEKFYFAPKTKNYLNIPASVRKASWSPKK